MNCLKSLVVAAVLVVSASWCHAQQPASANEMVVEASRLIMSAESAPTPERAISLLEEAHRKLVLITEVHPSSEMAVKLATGQGIGTISLAGVQRAIKAATEQCWTSLSLVCVARLTVETAMSADRDENWGSIWSYPLARAAKAQATAGQFDVAVKTAEMVDHTSSWRTRALLDVAAAQRKAGKAEEARILMDKALAFAESIDDEDKRARALAQVATAQAEAGQFAAAVKTAATINDAERRTNALLSIAAIQTKAGNVEDARTTAKRAADAARAIRDPYDRARVLSDVASAYIDMGERESALTTVDAATAAVSDRQAYHQALTLTTVAAAQTKAGNIRAARESIRQATAVAKSIQDSSQRTGRLKAIVPAGVEAEQFIEAAQVAEMLTDPDDRALALVDVALAQAKAGKVEAARLTIEMADDSAKLIDEPLERAYAHALIANVRTTTGDITDRTTTDIVVEAAQSLQDAYDRARLFAAVSLAQIEAGHIDDAQATIKLADAPAMRIDDPVERAYTLALVARVHANGGFDSAQATIAQAVEAAVSLEDPTQRTTRLREMASAYAEAGHSAEATATATLIKEARGQAQALAAVALAQVESGRMEQAQETITRAAETAKSNDVDAGVLATIATAQAKAGMVEAAQTTFRDAFQDIESKSYWYPGYMLAEVALAQATAGQSEDARVTIDRAVAAVQSGDASSRARALTAVAKAQTKAGQNEATRQTLTAAFEATQAVADVKARLRWLFNIAAAQAEAGGAKDARLTIDTAIKHFKFVKNLLEWHSFFRSSRGDPSLSLAADQLTAIVESFTSPEFENSLGKDDLFSQLGLFLGRRAAQFTAALETIGLIENPRDRILPLTYIAEAQAKAGQIADARATIGLATEAVKASGGGAFYLILIAGAQVEAGLVGDAKDSLRKALRDIKQEVTGGGRLRSISSSDSLSDILEILLEIHEASLL